MGQRLKLIHFLSTTRDVVGKVGTKADAPPSTVLANTVRTAYSQNASRPSSRSSPCALTLKHIWECRSSDVLIFEVRLSTDPSNQKSLPSHSIVKRTLKNQTVTFLGICKCRQEEQKKKGQKKSPAHQEPPIPSSTESNLPGFYTPLMP